MRRREFITLLGGAAAWVSPARAQEPRRVIGYLGSSSPDTFPDPLAAFVQALKDTGFIEGKNLSIEWRWAEGQYNRLPSLAGELVSRGVAVIVAGDAPASSAAKAATKTTPIVFMTGADPVKTGLVDSFSRPGGNLTGFFVLLSMLGSKHVELLRELVPSTSTFALLVNRNNPNVADVPEIEAAANALGRRLEVLTASTESDLEAAFAMNWRWQPATQCLIPRSHLGGLIGSNLFGHRTPVRENDSDPIRADHHGQRLSELHQQAGRRSRTPCVRADDVIESSCLVENDP